MTTDYADVAEIKNEIGKTDSASDAIIGRVITATSRLIDAACGFPRRRFYKTTNETRYFTAEDATFIYIDDCVAITSVQTDMDGDGVFETTWALTTDYLPAPYNAPLYGQPYLRLEIPSPAITLMPAARHGLKIVGDWGWPAVPAEVTEACIKQASRLFKRKDAPFGVAPIPGDAGSGIRLLSRLDPDVEMMLKRLVRPVGVVA